jgi:EAL domain-containing protein (putative c-di-GMP-specific phosphodiesterase class I)
LNSTALNEAILDGQLAEGIETEAQAAWLFQHGCRLGLGFLFARPEAFDVLLERVLALRPD